MSYTKDHLRGTMRLCTRFMLDGLDSLRRATGMDLMSSVIYLKIVDANTGLIDEVAETEGRFQAIDDMPPDELREPISVYNIAQALGLPYETTRRHVQMLIEEGLVRRVGGHGVIVHSEGLARPAMLANVVGTAAYVDDFVDTIINLRSSEDEADTAEARLVVVR